MHKKLIIIFVALLSLVGCGGDVDLANPPDKYKMTHQSQSKEGVITPQPVEEIPSVATLKVEEEFNVNPRGFKRGSLEIYFEFTSSKEIKCSFTDGTLDWCAKINIVSPWARTQMNVLSANSDKGTVEFALNGSEMTYFKVGRETFGLSKPGNKETEVVVRSGQNLNAIIRKYNSENNTAYTLTEILNKNPHIINGTVHAGDKIKF